MGTRFLGGVAITPNGATAYVADAYDGTVVPIDTATNTAGTPITVGSDPVSIAIAPNGVTAYVVNDGDGTVTPINTATNTAGTPISAGENAYAIAIAPDGSTAYVDDIGSSVTPIDLATDEAEPAIPVGSTSGFSDIAITPNGATAYVTNDITDTVTPIDLATKTAGTAIAVADQPIGIAITPDGATAYAACSTDGTGSVTPIDTATNTAGTPIAVGQGDFDIAIDSQSCPALKPASIHDRVHDGQPGEAREHHHWVATLPDLHDESTFGNSGGPPPRYAGWWAVIGGSQPGMSEGAGPCQGAQCQFFRCAGTDQARRLMSKRADESGGVQVERPQRSEDERP